MTEGAVKVAVSRLRERYRECLKAEIAHTVASPAGAEEEPQIRSQADSGCQWQYYRWKKKHE